ncbi:trypsin-like serine peptidase [Pseudonocardia charpentierae]|uniref:Serine protease n=1 Tax=Pseudonocardia charpentierae TaxID=3075545 RepID=A0ABU2NIW9_9PSEU|nr:serine protease [Pseudonocardia sp. DSM 45834]MDT0353916.1 serine protease [Pseudonocardia sp. DSM 45834]
MTIWDEGPIDWTTGDGLSAVQLFEHAYPDRASAKVVAAAVGLAWPATADGLGLSLLWATLLADAARDRLLLPLAAELLTDPQRSRFVTPMKGLLGARLGLANAHWVARHGLPESTEARDALLETLDIAEVADVILPGSEGGLQTINVPLVATQGIDEPIRVLLDARRRVAAIRRGRAVVGTGFLVAPDCLMTAAHVLHSRGEPGQSDLGGVDVVFDYHPRGTTRAQTGVAVKVLEVLRSSPPSPHELPPVQPDWDAADDRLDYALLRLERRVGDEPTPDTGTRGYYLLDGGEPDLTRVSWVSVFHFPRAALMSWSVLVDAIAFNPAGTKTRMRYRTNTEPGSSGGPIVDQLGRLIGMHHYGNSQRNQAVPIWRIAKAVDDLLTAPTLPLAAVPAVTAAPLPHRTLQVGPRPLVNRESLRDKVWTAMTDAQAARSMVIVGNTDSGVSWSCWLLKHMAAEAHRVPELQTSAPAGVEIIEIDLRKSRTMAPSKRRAALVDPIMARLASADGATAPIGQVARQVVHFREWCYQRLLASKRQWWVFVDSIDQITEIERHGVDEILYALVELADDPQTTLRLVLAGQEADRLGHESLRWAVVDRPDGLSRDEVGRWLDAKAAERGVALPPRCRTAFLAKWFPTMTTAQQPIELSLALPDAVRNICASVGLGAGT